MLTEQDYRVILSVLDVSAQKGLFRPADFVAVGNLYDKIQKILETAENNKTES